MQTVLLAEDAFGVVVFEFDPAILTFEAAVLTFEDQEGHVFLAYRVVSFVDGHPAMLSWGGLRSNIFKNSGVLN